MSSVSPAPSVPFRCTDFIRLDKLPTCLELTEDVVCYRFIRKHQKDLQFSYLIPDLWNIVSSFFFGYYNCVNVSVPLREIFDVPMPKTEENQMNIARLTMYRNIRYFYGREDGNEFQFRTGDGFMKVFNVSGHYPLNINDVTSSRFIMHRFGEQLNDRFLVCIEPQWVNKQRSPLRFVWHKNFSQTFSTWHDTVVFHHEHPQILVFMICDGALFREDFFRLRANE